jgi:SsrA-binding protein
MTKKKASTNGRPNARVVSENRKARHRFEVLDSLECGLALTGSEVKSLRGGKANIQEAYAAAKDGEIFLMNSYIPEYTEANRLNHEPRRIRKLLVRGREASKLATAVQREGMTLVPLKIFFNPRGIAKVELGVAKGKKLHDKRQSEKSRDWARDKARLIRARG